MFYLSILTICVFCSCSHHHRSNSPLIIGAVSYIYFIYKRWIQTFALCIVKLREKRQWLRGRENSNRDWNHCAEIRFFLYFIFHAFIYFPLKSHDTTMWRGQPVVIICADKRNRKKTNEIRKTWPDLKQDFFYFCPANCFNIWIIICVCCIFTDQRKNHRTSGVSGESS